MALNVDSLKEKIRANLTMCGFASNSQNECLLNAIAKAVVEEIKSNAEVVVMSGSSAGIYKVG